MGTEEMIIKWYTPTLFSKELKAKKERKGQLVIMVLIGKKEIKEIKERKEMWD